MHSLALAGAGFGTFVGAAAIVLIADQFRQLARGARLPLGQIEQNIQPEKKSTFLKPTQRPLSVPNLKSLFHGNTKSTNDENQDVEKNAQSEYLPTVYVPPTRRGLAKRSTTIFRDPVLKIVEEVDDGSIPTSAAAPERDGVASHDATAPQPGAWKYLPASSNPCDSITECAKDIALAQPDANKNNTASAPQITSTRNITNTHTDPPALSHVSEPEVQDIPKATNATEQSLNLPALLNNSEPSVLDAQIITDVLKTKVNPPALSAISELDVRKITTSSELKESLVVKKVRGPTKRQSNAALPINVDIRQVTTTHHVIPYLHGARNASLPGMPMLSEDRIVTAFLRSAPPPSIPVNEAATSDSIHDAGPEENNEHLILGSAIPMASQGRKASAQYITAQAPTLPTLKEPEFQWHVGVKEDAHIRKSSLDNGPPLPDPNAPKGLLAAVARGIQANVPKSNEPIPQPKDEATLSIKKRRDTTLRAAEYPQPMPWAPALQPTGTHYHVENCAAVGMLGHKAVQSRHLTPHYTLPTELHGVDPCKEDDAYDSYDEEDDYVTARSYRSNGDNTNDGATTDLFPRYNPKARREIAEAAVFVESTRTQEDVEDEATDPTMVAEYADEIFTHLRHLEVKMLPNPFYMEEQNELQWSMRSVLMDWLVQVHSRCNLLPETLFITANYVDRFLSGKVVSLGKLQLVGATALFLAAKKEEINCPTLSEIVYMVDNTYSAEELIKAERFMLNILKWELEFPGPMSFLRRISKADDYDLETRTLAKYFLEVSMMEERFIATPSSFCAAASHCLARLMLKKGLWTPFHVYYSNYTYSQLYPLLRMLLHCVENPVRHHAAVYEKYADKRFKRASTYVEVQMQRGFVLPNLPTSSNRNIADDMAATYPMATYSNLFNYQAVAATSSGREFSS